MKKILSIALFVAVAALVSCKDDDPVAVSGVTLDKPLLELTVGYSQTLVATVAPGNAGDKSVTWLSDDPSIASVSDTGEVTAVAAGTTTVTVTTADGGQTAPCTVVVTPTTTIVSFPNLMCEVNEYNAEGYAKIPILLGDRMQGDITCTVKATDGTAVSTGNAWDYKLPGAEFVIEKGTTEGYVILNLQDSYCTKEDRSLKLTITGVRSSCANETVVLSDRIWECMVTIMKVVREADFSESLIVTDKQSSPVEFGLCLTAPVRQDVLVTVGAKDGGTLVENTDYSIGSHQFTIKAGETSATTKITVLRDVEGYCDFEITDITGDVDVSADAICRLTIQKNQ